MFMQHFIKMLKTGGRAGIVIKNTFLSNGDASALRKLLLEQCNLHTILDLPSGVFQGAGVKTVVLFFDKGKKTEKIWYYQLNPGRNLGKTNALNEEDLADFLRLQNTKADSENSWTIDCRDLGEDCDLSVKNPNKVEEKDERTPQEVFENLNNLQSKADDILEALQEEFWKDDIDDVFGFADENSDDYIVNHRLTKEERREYDELVKQADELREMKKSASSDERDSLKRKVSKLYERMEDLIDKYKDDEEEYEEDEE
jgi:type I restriction enzyme M protein